MYEVYLMQRLVATTETYAEAMDFCRDAITKSFEGTGYKADTCYINTIGEVWVKMSDNEEELEETFFAIKYRRN